MIKTKKILGDEARIKLKKGIDLVADYTKLTLGPKGRNVAFKKIGPLPTRVVNDGVTIAQEVKDDDPFVSAGIEMVQEICKKTNDNAGDGTTQTALLAQAIVAAGFKRLSSGFNATDIEKEIVADVDNLLVELKKISKPVKTVDDVRNIATISGNNDPEIGDALASIVEKVGMHASIIIDRGTDVRIRTEAVDGIYFNKGYQYPAFINNFKQTAEYKDPKIFIVNEAVRYNSEIEEFFDVIVNNKLQDIIFICKEIEGDALGTFAETHIGKMRGEDGVFLLPLIAPGVGPDQDDFMEDLASAVNAKVIGGNNSYKLNNFKEIPLSEVMGTCERLVSTSKNTTILLGDKKENKELHSRISLIEKQISELDSAEKVTREKLEKRRDMLTSGVGIIYSGGSTEIEIKDRNLRLEDAALASKAAISDGFVPGGGYTYLLLQESAKSDIMKEALSAVAKQVALNAGEVPELIVARSLEYKKGWNAKSGKFEDLLESGVIDATSVVKNALRNATSLAGRFLTTEALVVEYDDGNKDIKK